MQVLVAPTRSAQRLTHVCLLCELMPILRTEKVCFRHGGNTSGTSSTRDLPFPGTHFKRRVEVELLQRQWNLCPSPLDSGFIWEEAQVAKWRPNKAAGPASQ
mmetsp:Transcript_16312/g.22792  ORF Transcript_16312/g.22792 Transcript_16312/m.22792 type:complete len:102 (+) Transcript_16312:77-382(+)